MTRRFILIPIALLAILSSPVAASAPPKPVPADWFLAGRLRNHQVIFLGTRHHRPRLLGFVGDQVDALFHAGLSHVGLEIGSDQQAALDRFMAGKGARSRIRIDPNIDCEAYRTFLERLRSTGVNALALDLPRRNWASPVTRDQWMALRLAEAFSADPRARILVVVGNLHVLKRIDWQSSVLPTGGIRHYLAAHRPGLRLLSVAQSIGQRPGQCPYADRFGDVSAPVAVVPGPASPLPGFLRLAAVKPAAVRQLLDAVIVYGP